MSEQELGTKQQPEKKQENGKEQEPEKKKVHKFVHLTPKVPKRPHACDRCRKAKVKVRLDNVLLGLHLPV